jgi:hypothetical protein
MRIADRDLRNAEQCMIRLEGDRDFAVRHSLITVSWRRFGASRQIHGSTSTMSREHMQ